MLPVLLLLAAAQGALLTEPSAVKDCQPCRIQPAPKDPIYRFFFDIARDDEGRAVRKIVAKREQQPDQVLDVKAMTPVGPDESFFFGPEDINFDGYEDLLLITDRGTANSYAQYWLFVPQKLTFSPIGRYPYLKPDPKTKRLHTYERGGHGGLEYEKNEYAFNCLKLVLQRSEKQRLLGSTGKLRRTVRKRVQGRMRTVTTRTLTQAQAAAGN